MAHQAARVGQGQLGPALHGHAHLVGHLRMLGAIGRHRGRMRGIQRMRLRIQRIAGNQIGHLVRVGRRHHARHPRADQVVRQSYRSGVAGPVPHDIGDAVVGLPRQVDGRDQVARRVGHRLHRHRHIAAVHATRQKMAAQQGLGAHLVHHAVGHRLGHRAVHRRRLGAIRTLRHRLARLQGVAGLLIPRRIGRVHRLQRPYRRALVAEHLVGEVHRGGIARGIGPRVGDMVGSLARQVDRTHRAAGGVRQGQRALGRRPAIGSGEGVAALHQRAHGVQGEARAGLGEHAHLVVQHGVVRAVGVDVGRLRGL